MQMNISRQKELKEIVQQKDKQILLHIITIGK